jgi:hypothetical protein
MTNLAIDYVNLTRICEFARRLHKLHRVGDDEAIDREFSAVCRAIWGYTLDDFTDDDLSPEDHLWLDGLTQECAFDFAAQQGYDLKDYIHGGPERTMPNDTAAATLIFIGTSVSLEPTQGHVPPEPTRHATLYRTRAKPSPARGGGSGFRKRGARHSRRRRVASFKATSVL